MRKHVESTARSLRFLPVILAVAALLACGKSHNQTGSASRSANEPPALAIDIDTATVTKTVKGIDYETRTLTLESQNGATESYRASPDIKNFDQIQVGDKVRATVTDALAVAVRRSGTPPNGGEAVAVSLAPKGAKPGILVERTAEATAKIVNVDPASRTITVTELPSGPKTIKLAPSANVSDLKKGDDVVVRYTHALAINVSKP
jgi:Cu/Ag efflux protein CusF